MKIDIKRLQQAMDRKNIKQAELSRSVNVSRATINQYLSGRCNPTYEKALKLSKVLGINIDWLSGKDCEMIDKSIIELSERLNNTKTMNSLVIQIDKLRLQKAMNRKNLSQAELSILTEIPRTTINQYLSGRCNAKYENIIKLASVLEINTEWLLGNDCAMLINTVHNKIIRMPK